MLHREPFWKFRVFRMKTIFRTTSKYICRRGGGFYDRNKKKKKRNSRVCNPRRHVIYFIRYGALQHRGIWRVDVAILDNTVTPLRFIVKIFWQYSERSEYIKHRKRDENGNNSNDITRDYQKTFRSPRLNSTGTTWCVERSRRPEVLRKDKSRQYDLVNLSESYVTVRP